MIILKGSKIKINGQDWIILEHNLESRGIYTEGRPVKRVECFEIDNDYIPVSEVEIEDLQRPGQT